MHNVKFFIDIDQTVRDLLGALPSKDVLYVNSDVLYDIVCNDLSILSNAKPTKYYNVIKEFFPKPTFVTFQPMVWIPHTEMWLKKFFPSYDVLYLKSFKEKQKFFDTNLQCYIIEDYPLYNNYDRIILIDHLYNRNVKNPFKRVSTAKQLRKVLEQLIKEDND